jgi:AGCS family alanine or glycine:cation symporter
MVYLKKGLQDYWPRMAWLGVLFSPLFAVLTILASFGGGNMFQSNQTYAVAKQIFHLENYPIFEPLFGIGIATLVGIVIIGGIKRIGDVTSRMVPAMCLGYMGICLFIVLANLSAAPRCLRISYARPSRPMPLSAGSSVCSYRA